MKDTLGVAGIQMEVRSGNDNSERMFQLIKRVAFNFPWVELIVFSELCAYGPLTHYAYEIPGQFEHEMQAMADKYAPYAITILEEVDK